MSADVCGPNKESLTPYKSRQFVPGCSDLTKPETVEELYKRLINFKIDSAGDLERFILNRSELAAAVGQAQSLLHVMMTCKTDDKSIVEAYQNFTEKVVPVMKPLEDELDKKYIAAREKYPDQYDHYKLHDLHLKTDIELFRQENIDLSTKESLLSQEYQQVCGAMTVEFEGDEKTLPMMGKYLLENDRNIREESWRLVWQRRLKDAEQLDGIFDSLYNVRKDIANNCGFDNFRDFRYKQWYRFDYSPEDCRKFHNAVEKLVVPLVRDIIKKRAVKMGLESLRPWDLACDPLGRSPLKPFEKAEELISGCAKIFNKVDTELGKQFQSMIDDGLLDLASRKGKAPGGYQATMLEARKPFIFMNAAGTNTDLTTLLHEGGHAFHMFASRHLDPISYRHAPMEFCEVASMSMELLAMPYISEFYNEDDSNRAVTEHFERILDLLCWVATVDCFQHELYENPKLDIEGRHQKWQEVVSRFGDGGLIDWTGLEKEKKYQWHRQIHVFQYPLYYMEYGIAQLGALGIWLQALNDPQRALANYKNALSLGGSRSLKELFEAAELKFGMDEETFLPLVEAVSKQIHE